GLIFLSSYSFLSPTERSQLHATELERTLDDIVVAHETAHQWWGDSLVWSSYRDQWLIEALANYSALMLLESSDPAKFWLALDSYRDNLLLKDKQDRTLMEAGPVTLGSRLTSSYFPFGYDAISYGRGTWLIHMLRTMMRDAGKPSPDPSQEPFMRALRRLHDRFEGKSITSSDLLKVLAEELPTSLRYEGKPSMDWFFQSWINGTAVPKFELQGVKYLDRPAGTAVSGTIF